LTTYIPEEKIIEVEQATDIVDIISETVILKKVGANYIGLCPFHSEKTPSFTVSPEKKIFHCFGCGIGGTVFNFIMKYNGIAFPEAVRMLSSKLGIDIAYKMSKEQKKKINAKKELFLINNHAMDFFHSTLLNGPKGENARQYLTKRGLTDNTISAFKIGYAPKSWNSLLQYFSKKGISLSLAESAGLIIAKENTKGFFDRFRNRIIFPILDLNKQVAGFGGRVMDNSKPKYLNSPETSVYSKSRCLYGLDKTRSNCRENDSVFIVEGYFDLLSLVQYGVKNVVATCGTALTSDHIRILKGFAQKMFMLYDSDKAGDTAALRSIDICIREGVNAGVVKLPDGYDPDSYICEFGYEKFMNITSKVQSIIPFLINNSVKKHGLSVEGKLAIIKDLKNPLLSIGDRMAKSLYIKELADCIKVDEKLIIENIRDLDYKEKNKVKRFNRPLTTPQNKLVKSQLMGNTHNKITHQKLDKLECKIIAMMLQFPDIIAEVNKRNLLELFRSDILKSLGTDIIKYLNVSANRIVNFLNMIEDNNKKQIIVSLAIEDTFLDYKGCFQLMTQLECSRSRYDDTALLEQIKAAENNNDFELILKLLKNKQIQAEKSTR